jgi:uncharacterized membrane protein YraQ (UPF0718 family)
MTFLIASLLAYALGPPLCALIKRHPHSFSILDGFVFVSMSGLIFFGLLPEVLHSGGWPSLVFAALGLFLPTWVEKRFHGLERNTHRAALAIGLLGLLIHEVVDGVALSVSGTVPIDPNAAGALLGQGHAHVHDHAAGLDAHHPIDLPLAVVLHRLPVAITVWWLVERNFGKFSAAATLVLMGLATVLGYSFGESSRSWIEGTGAAWFQAFVVGSLLHVVVHRLHRPPRSESAGAIATQGTSSTSAAATASCCDHAPSQSPTLRELPILAVPIERAHSDPSPVGPTVFAAGRDSIPTAPNTASCCTTESDSLPSTQYRSCTAAATRNFFGLHASWAGLGGVLGLTLLVLLFWQDGAHFRWDGEDGFGSTFFELALASAPALLLGYTLAGLAAEFLPVASIRWLGRGGRFSRALRGMILGLPIPVCSCGVVPIYRTLIRRSAPLSAAIAFLVATPELGIDAFLLSLPLLGRDFTIIRVVAAAVVALLVGVIVSRVASRDELSGPTDASPDAADESTTRARREAFGVRLRRALSTGFGEVADKTGPWILLGLVAAAIVDPFLDDGFLRAVGPALQVVLFTLIGIPTYICASGATPLAAVLLSNGVAPGAVLAFLITGPATNVTTFGVLASLHGRRIALAFSLATIICAIAAGWIVNGLGPSLVTIPELEHDHANPSILELSALAILAIVFVLSLLRRGPRAVFSEIFRLPGSSLEADGSPAIAGDGSDGEVGDEYGHDHSHGHAHAHAHGTGNESSEPAKRSCCGP